VRNKRAEVSRVDIMMWTCIGEVEKSDKSVKVVGCTAAAERATIVSGRPRTRTYPRVHGPLPLSHTHGSPAQAPRTNDSPPSCTGNALLTGTRRSLLFYFRSPRFLYLAFIYLRRSSELASSLLNDRPYFGVTSAILRPSRLFPSK
jgi:hypothetical protein